MAICENDRCKKEHSGEFGSGRFCNRTCANSHIPTKEHREKTSDSLRGKTPNRTDPVKWKAAIVSSLKKRRDARHISIMSLPFNELTWPEIRSRILAEQNGQCALCGIIPVWNGNELKFECDHIDGNHTNDARENLRMICPNCHSQTPTFRRNNSTVTVSDTEFAEALRHNLSIYLAIKSLKMRGNGGTYRRARRIIAQYQISMPLRD